MHTCGLVWFSERKLIVTLDLYVGHSIWLSIWPFSLSHSNVKRARTNTSWTDHTHMMSWSMKKHLLLQLKQNKQQSWLLWQWRDIVIIVGGCEILSIQRFGPWSLSSLMDANFWSSSVVSMFDDIQHFESLHHCLEFTWSNYWILLGCKSSENNNVFLNDGILA